MDHLRQQVSGQRFVLRLRGKRQRCFGEILAVHRISDGQPKKCGRDALQLLSCRRVYEAGIKASMSRRAAT